jgi:hypothetical protein
MISNSSLMKLIYNMPKFGVRRLRNKDNSVHQLVQTGYETHSGSYAKCTEVYRTKHKYRHHPSPVNA